MMAIADGEIGRDGSGVSGPMGPTRRWAGGRARRLFRAAQRFAAAAILAILSAKLTWLSSSGA